jgi:hypothetical protein
MTNGKYSQGPSGAGNTSCISALDPGCWSSGPDAAAGAISISLSRLDAYDFTLSYATNKQAQNLVCFVTAVCVRARV